MHLSVLSNKDLESIHRATLQILETTGIRLAHPTARDLLQQAGCQVRGDWVLIPAQLLENSLGLCPSHFTMEGRGGKTITLGDGTLHWHNTAGAHTLFDPASGNFKPAGIQEIRNATRLLDALEGVDEITPFFSPQDVPSPLVNLAMYRHALPCTTKPLSGPGVQSAQEVGYIYRMAEVVGQPREMLSLPVSPISPLHFPDDLAAAILETARLGIPFYPLPAPNAGGTAPMTLAGALAQQNAEVLASILLAQLVQPGLPVVYCGRLSFLEPRTGGSVWGISALGLASAACVQMAHHYQLPVDVYGLATDSNQPDLQNGYERALNAVLPGLAGADELSGIGDLGAGVISSYAQMVSDNDIVLSIKQILKGIHIDEPSLAVGLIGEVMQSNGNFLAERHTVKTLRSGEVYYPPLADRRLYDEWNKAGKNGMNEHAQAKAERLLREHKVPPLEPQQDKELDRIMHAAQNELCI